MKGVLRVISCGPLHPAYNMALDEALLTLGGPPTLRLYEWEPPAVSLGRFQAAPEFPHPPKATVVVRRPTGGGAIHHERDLTFALALEAGLLPRGLAASYSLVHGAVAAALARLGVTAAPPPGSPRVPARRRPAGWCFHEASPFDLVLPDGRKLVGSAQRRSRGRILHHGSIPLAPPSFTPKAGFAGVSREGLEPLLVEELAAGLDLRPSPGAATAEEARLARELAVAPPKEPAP